MGVEKKTGILFLGIKEREHQEDFKYGFYGKNLGNGKIVAYRDIPEMALNVAKHLGKNYIEKVSFSPPSEEFYELSQKDKSDLDILVEKFVKKGEFHFSHGTFPVYDLD